MELQSLVERFAEGFAVVDVEGALESFNQRTGEAYLPGLKTLKERSAVHAVDAWWPTAHPGDFNPRSAHFVEVSYPGLARARCDFVVTTDGELAHEWAVEVKNVALVGNNGKNNDFCVPKVLSPYLKDRSLMHDILRLRQYPVARRQAVLGYAFEYSLETCTQALERHPQHAEFIGNIRSVCKTNDPVGGRLPIEPLIDFADEIFRSRRLVVGPVCQAAFEAWRHPCGGYGRVFAWEVAPRSATAPNDGASALW